MTTADDTRTDHPARTGASVHAVHTDAAPVAVGAYSQAVVVGDLVFVSGQLPIDPATGEFAGPGVREEAAQSLRNGAAVLEAAGSGIAHVVKTTVLLADIADFAVVNEVYAEVFSAGGGVLPARAAYQVGALPKGARVEIEFVGAVVR
ncbi:Rid family detoxifying hydrolase [Frigoribacterium sp. VKM Ac-2530]|uniref:Rid family detoxifying hydrolase n=1 Tax=Frigoribacterium sp. VKM Ac-2530 TaxID=2783822 RepID=UPI00188A08F7|nr:Rid family detoxifying hydrolase [Frigoribacterium sp. VKM Ac-2530]MBF4579666.1 hypothetical protein [Frigoribacterium sp. VKM Ac-2530]